MAKYETSVTFEGFSGIDQSIGNYNLNLNTAYRAENMNTERGALGPANGYKPVYPPLDDKIVTLCSFYRRSHPVEAERSVLVAATDSAVYCIVETWTAWKLLMSGFESGNWSWVTYETVRGESENQSTVDVLIMSNAKDGMITVYGDDLTAEKKADVPKFGLLARHSERIWGAGIIGEPDNLYYSQPYKPFEWGMVYDETGGVTTQLPEESGGVIQVPTWDGDEFMAIKRYANYLIALKKNSMHYIRGLSPGEFAVYEAFGSDGALASKTLVVDGAGAFYLSERGLGVYTDGSAQLLDNDRLFNIFSRVSSHYPESACATTRHHIIYLALPIMTGETETAVLNGIEITKEVQPERNNMLIEYDIRRSTYMVRTGFKIDAIHNHMGKLLFAGGDDPFQIYEIAGNTYNNSPISCVWESGWQDLGAKNATKSAFVVLITGFNSTEKQKINVSIETEKKIKTRTIILTPGMKKARYRINNSGRKFKLIIESESTSGWTINGGIQLDMELDAD